MRSETCEERLRKAGAAACERQGRYVTIRPRDLAETRRLFLTRQIRPVEPHPYQHGSHYLT